MTGAALSIVSAIRDVEALLQSNLMNQAQAKFEEAIEGSIAAEIESHWEELTKLCARFYKQRRRALSEMLERTRLPARTIPLQGGSPLVGTTPSLFASRHEVAAAAEFRKSLAADYRSLSD
jgi:hypothetical protein